MNSFSPCPQCHSRRIHIAEWYRDDSETEYYGVCDDCGYEDPDRFEEPDVAVDHWNRRVVMGYIDGEDPTDTEYDKLEEDDWDKSRIRTTIPANAWGVAMDGMHVFDPNEDDEC